MNILKKKRAISELEEILEKEHATLLAGDLDKLESIVEEKERAIGRLDKTLRNGVSESELRLVRTRLARNQSLILASRRGLQAANDRIGNVLDASKGLKTYTKSLVSRSLRGAD